MHVRDLDRLEDANRRRSGDRGARVVRVDVHLQGARVADDEQRVAEPLQLRLERVRVELLALDEDDRAVAVARQLLMDRVESDSLRRLGFRQRLARDAGRDPAKDLDEPGAAGVDDSRLAEHGQLLGRPPDRVLAPLDHVEEEVRDGRLRCGTLLGLLGQLPDDGQHRPLDRLPHRAIRRVARPSQRGRERRRVDRRRLAENVRGAPDDLREDHPGVAPRAHQRGAGDGACDGRPVGGRRRLERLDDRAHGQGQVRSGVAVRHGIDVQIVDPAPVLLQVRERRRRELADAVEIGLLRHEPRLTSSMCTSTADTVKPVSRSTSYATCERIVAATSARLSPYSTTT